MTNGPLLFEDARTLLTCENRNPGRRDRPTPPRYVAGAVGALAVVIALLLGGFAPGVAAQPGSPVAATTIEDGSPAPRAETTPRTGDADGAPARAAQAAPIVEHEGDEDGTGGRGRLKFIGIGVVGVIVVVVVVIFLRRRFQNSGE